MDAAFEAFYQKKEKVSKIPDKSKSFTETISIK
jgi:hypothetical protein